LIVQAINRTRPASHILTDASPKDPVLLESRALHLLVGAGINAFPGSSEMSKEKYLEKYYNNVLDWNCYFYLLLITFSISSARPISRFVMASTSNDFKESLTVFQLMVIIG
jgi:hypothetical protein